MDIDCDHNNKYNIKDSPILTSQPGNSSFVRLDPEDFHNLVLGKKNPTREELKDSGVDFHNEEEVRKALCEGKPMRQPMYLDYNKDRGQNDKDDFQHQARNTGKITGHEGRMRAEIAKDIGMDNIPVLVLCHSDEKRKATCDFSSGIDLRRKTEPQMNIEEMRK